MTIVKLKKSTVVCKSTEKEAVLHTLQGFGALHLNSLSVGENTQSKVLEPDKEKLNEKLKNALRYLQDCPLKRKQLPWQAQQNVEQLILDICDNQARKRVQTDVYEKLLEREANMAQWGEFHFSELQQMAGQRLWFYILPYKHLKSLHSIELPWAIVHKEHHKAWVVLIAAEEPASNLLPVARLHTGSVPLSALKAQRQEAERLIEDLEYERQDYTRYINILKRLTNRIEDQSNFHHALDLSLDAEPFSLIEAWIAEKKVSELYRLANAQGFAVNIEAVGEHDNPPTLLSNPPAIRGGEALVNFYQSPAYASWDPSFILFASFSIFFAMIMSDAAYSAILLASLLIAWKKIGRRELGRNLRPLMLSISGVSIVWGMMVGSYFGKSPPESVAWLRAVNILDVNDFDTMMAISIACGITHIALANLQQLVLCWGHRKALMHAGWILVLLAGAALGFALEATYAYLAGGVGLALVFVGGGKSKTNSVKGFVLRFFEGLKAISNITNIFGDVLSYLRLFALGLASASLALTFNDLASNAFASDSGFGLVFGLLILIVGHALNLFLGLVSGVVHGLRLNFIEFYKWALDGEGKPFKAFKKQEYPQ